MFSLRGCAAPFSESCCRVLPSPGLCLAATLASDCCPPDLGKSEVVGYDALSIDFSYFKIVSYEILIDYNF